MLQGTPFVHQDETQKEVRHDAPPLLGFGQMIKRLCYRVTRKNLS